MEELDPYECFGVPAHVWHPDDVITVAVRRVTAYPRMRAADSAMLGMEAMPSPALAEFGPAR